MMDRRRALMMEGSRGDITNGLVDGTYTVSGGSIVVNNNILSPGTVANYKNYDIPFIHSIPLQAGDIITFRPINDNPDGATTAPAIGLNGSFYTSGGSFRPYANPPTSKTVTISNTMTAQSFRLQTVSNMSNKPFGMSILVNGEVIF